MIHPVGAALAAIALLAKSYRGQGRSYKNKQDD